MADDGAGAGPELDALVARCVIGWTAVGVPHGVWWYSPVGAAVAVPPYSTDISAAWQVIERLRELGYTNISISTEAGGWEVELSGSTVPGVVGLNSPTAPLAICRAALLAVERAALETNR